jgi:8-oxo-dGTP diphosphatase
MLKVEFSKVKADESLVFVVILARYHGKWVFVRHEERNTWEISGGHIEEGETPLEAAKRELNEETGAVAFELYELCTYTVHREQNSRSGRLFFAEIQTFEALKHEIQEIKCMVEMPEEMTYPEIQPHLFKYVKDSIKELDL